MSNAAWIEMLTRATLGAIWVGAVTYSMFVVGYVWHARHVWWRVWPGRALVVSSTSTSLLLVLTLVFRKVEPSPLVGAAITTGIVCMVAAGGLLKLGALAHGWWSSNDTPLPPDPH